MLNLSTIACCTSRVRTKFAREVKAEERLWKWHFDRWSFLLWGGQLPKSEQQRRLWSEEQRTWRKSWVLAVEILFSASELPFPHETCPLCYCKGTYNSTAMGHCDKGCSHIERWVLSLSIDSTSALQKCDILSHFWGSKTTFWENNVCGKGQGELMKRMSHTSETAKVVGT